MLLQRQEAKIHRKGRDQTHNHQVMSPTHSPLSHMGGWVCVCVCEKYIDCGLSTVAGMDQNFILCKFFQSPRTIHLMTLLVVSPTRAPHAGANAQLQLFFFKVKAGITKN